MAKIKITNWDVAESLDSEKIIAGYLSEIFATGSGAEIKSALSDVVRAYGIMELSKKAGITHVNFCRLLSSDANPKYETIQKIATALDIHLGAVSNSSQSALCA